MGDWQELRRVPRGYRKAAPARIAYIWWDIHYHAVGETIRDHVELGVWFYPKGQEPKYRTYLTGFQAVPRVGSSGPRHSAELADHQRRFHGA